ncbi:MAG TPA: cupin domain-containing protein [Actinokineospora sp.]|nr:cupin domain-containing protein [Actinokineospora sp.]
MTDQGPAVVDIRRQEPENLMRAYGLDLKLLQPWEGLNAPFRGAWCVLRPGDVSLPHAHTEHELFIAMAGRADVVTDGVRHQFAAGDIVFMKAGMEHFVANDHDEDFSYYAIWWDRTMADEFIGLEPESAPVESV